MDWGCSSRLHNGHLSFLIHQELAPTPVDRFLLGFGPRHHFGNRRAVVFVVREGSRCRIDLWAVFDSAGEESRACGLREILGQQFVGRNHWGVSVLRRENRQAGSVVALQKRRQNQDLGGEGRAVMQRSRQGAALGEYGSRKTGSDYYFAAAQTIEVAIVLPSAPVLT